MIFGNRPPLYLDYSGSIESLKIIPDATAGDNNATNPENVQDVIESDSFALITAGTSPLSVNITEDVSGLDSLGLISKARMCIQFKYTVDFVEGEIQYNTVRI